MLLSVVLLATLLPTDSKGAGGLNTPTSSPWNMQHKVAVRLVSTVAAIGKSDQVKLGLHFKMAPGWRIYWRNPVGSSFPPNLDTSDSENVKLSKIEWPVPTQIPVYGHLTLGYENEVVLPIAVRLKRPNEPLQFRAQLRYLACSEVCVPTDADLALILPRGNPVSTAEKVLIERYSVRVPRVEYSNGIFIESAEARDATKTDLTVEARSDTPFADPDIVVGGPDAFEFSKPSLRISDGGRTAIFSVPVTMIDETEPKRLPGTELVLIVTDDRGAVARRLTISTTSTSEGLGRRAISFLQNLLPSIFRASNQ